MVSVHLLPFSSVPTSPLFHTTAAVLIWFTKEMYKLV